MNEVMNDVGDLESLDPIRWSFALSKYAKLLSTTSPNHSKEYLTIQQNCTSFPTDLLHLCINVDEVNTLLDYAPADDGIKPPNWYLALYQEHKCFVAHPFFQLYHKRKMVGGLTWDTFYWYSKAWRYICAFLLFLILPIVALLDIFRKSDLLFKAPLKKKKEKISDSNVEDGKSFEIEKTKSGQEEETEDTAPS